MNKFLSTLANATPGCITYYTGNNYSDCQHLSQCDLICNFGFNPNLPGVNLIHVKNPQAYFYKLSKKYKEDYIEFDKLRHKNGSYIHSDARIHPTAQIYPGCTIGNVTIGKNCIIHPGCIIYSKTIIKDNTYIESNTVIGATGMMWVWDGEDKVFLEQLGGVIIGSNCKIGSNITIVRGSANENTIIGNGGCMAHGTKIGHGCNIGNGVHFANNVSLGGSVFVSESCFFGSGSTVSPKCKINSKIILGAGSCLTKSTEISGIYAGVPAKWIKSIGKSHSGVPSN